MKFKALSLGCAVILALAVQVAGAHHAANAFDRSNPLTVTGTVKKFRWSNPHCWLSLDVTNESGGDGEWVLEGASVSVLARSGWNSQSVKAGDKVKVLVAPRKDGKAGGEFLSVTLTETGQVLQWGPYARS
jgi:hypothetical protein